MSTGREKILLIERDEHLRRALEFDLAREGYAVLTASGGEQGLELLEKEKAALVVADVRMLGTEHLEILAAIRKPDPTRQVVVMTAPGTIGRAIEAMRAGAFHYVQRPPSGDELKLTIKTALRLRELEQESVATRRKLHTWVESDTIVAESQQMKHILEVVERVAHTETPVLILGESGTGKELIARAIHHQSPRSDKSFVAVNCATTPEELIESELFGHERWALPGATTTRRGKFELADGGTIFLEEVGDISLKTQARVLGVLEKQTLERLGGTEALNVDIRVVAAAERDLIGAVETGAFRRDLYYRLNVVPLSIPPLRERREDIRPLVQCFLRRLEAPPRLTVAPDASRALESYDWPGNVRELENAVERALIFHRGDLITLADLPETIRKPRARETLPLPVSLPEAGLSLEEVEKELIMRALQKHDWNQSRAARYLRITRHTLLYRMEKHRIVPPSSYPDQM